MSVSFSVVGLDMSLDDQLRFNMHNANARIVLTLVDLGAGAELCGQMRARELRRRCEGVLEGGYVDPGLSPQQDGRLFLGGRPAGHLESRLRDLIELCDRAGELGVVSWG